MSTETNGLTFEEMGIPTPETPEDGAEKRIAKLFKECSFMHVEDGQDAVASITEALRTKRENKKDEIDPGIGTATCINDVEPVFKKLMTEYSGTANKRIIVIQDMELPRKNDSFSPSVPNGGMESMKIIVNLTKTWNSENPDSPIQLEIIINSTIGDEEMKQRFNEKFGGDFIKTVVRPGAERQKVDVIKDIEELFRKDLKG